MSEACVAVECPLPDPEALGTPNLATWQRRIALGGLLAWLGFFAMLEESVDLGTPWFDWEYLWTGGFVFAQPCLLAAWAALRPGPVLLRLPQTIALAAFFGLAMGVSKHGDFLPRSFWVTEWFLVLVPSLVVLTAAFTLLRRFQRWHVRRSGDQGDLNTKGVQFSLKQMLTWTAGAAVILSLTCWLSPEGKLVSERFDPMSAAIVSACTLVPAIMLAPMMWLVLGERSRRGYAFWSIVAAAFSAAFLWFVFALLSAAGDPTELWSEAPQVTFFLGWIYVGLLALTLIVLIVLRLCGYRLVRSDRSRSANLPPADVPLPQQLSEQAIADAGTAAVPRPKATVRTGWIAALLTLAFAALLAPAFAVHAERVRLAEDSEYEKQWSALGGVSSQVRYGQVVMLQFMEKPISPAVFEKLQADADRIDVSHLEFTGQPIGDDELRCVSAVKSLICLRLDRTRITDAGLAYLVALTGLEDLDLGHTQVTDEGLKVLARMPSLRTLDLQGTAVTDAGLAQLEPLERLEILLLAGTKTTPKGIAAFKATSPNCSVTLPGPEDSVQPEACGAVLDDESQ